MAELRAAAESGSAEAQNQLGLLYSRGVGVGPGGDVERRCASLARAGGSLRRALAAVARRFVAQRAWERLVVTGMNQDWSWAHSAKQYVELYEKTIQRKRGSKAKHSYHPDYDHLRHIADTVGADSWELFAAIQNCNPYAAEVREEMLRNLQELQQRLADTA